MSFAVMNQVSPAAASSRSAVVAAPAVQTISVPTAVLPALHAICSEEPTRYALDAVRLQAEGRQCRADACDGRALVSVRWRQHDASQFAALVPRSLCASPIFERQAKRLKTVELEHDGRTVELAVDDRHSGSRARQSEAVAEGRFPNVDDVIRIHQRQKLVDKGRQGSGKLALELHVDAALFATLLQTVAAVATPHFDARPRVKLHIPLDGGAIQVEAADAERGTTAVGVIMPMTDD